MNSKIARTAITMVMILSLLIVGCGSATPSTPTSPSTTAPVAPTAPGPSSETTAPAAPSAEKPQAEVTKPNGEVPKYGGVLFLPLSSDLTRFSMFDHHAGTATLTLTNEKLQDGDWTKGPAGGYGINETQWETSTDIPALKTGYLAEKPLYWTVNTEKNEGTVIIEVRKGIRWAFDPNNAASRKVGGREFTADDVVHSINYRTLNPESFPYRTFPDLRGLKAVKSGPWEVSLTIPLPYLLQAVQRLFDAGPIQPPELDELNYGRNWRDSVGTGPFMLNDFVPGSSATLVRNPNYWGKDPIGPGKGNQLPYLDGVKFLIIPDASTRQAALRTGKIDQLGAFTIEDAAQMRKTAPALLNEPRGTGQLPSAYMRTDLSPFNDVRVRKAMTMAIDFETMNKGLYQGLGQIVTWPYWYEPAYAGLYLGLNDPDTPESIKELYTYNPEKAKQLLKEAGYPNGFKTELILVSTDVDYFSIIKDMWAKAGIDLKLDVKETGAVNNIRSARTHPQMIAGYLSPPSAFRLLATMYGITVNWSMVDDPIANEAYDKVNLAAITDMSEAMRLTRELTKYARDQAWVIGGLRYPTYTFWWPWVKNYSGESTIGYSAGGLWAMWIWYDTDLKKSLGY